MGKDKEPREGSLKTKMVEEQEFDDGVRRRSRRARNLPPQYEDVEEGPSGGSGSKRARFEDGEAGITKPEVKRETPPTMMTRQQYANLKKEGKEEVGLASLDETGTVALLEPGEASSSSAGGSSVACKGQSSGPGRQDKEQEEAHPCLFNEDVLDNIFKFILSQSIPKEEVAQDVQRIRLVCKTWRNSATRLYRQTRAYAQFKSCSRGFFPRRYSFAEFMDTMKHSDMIPVQRFVFSGDSFFHSRNRNIFRDFLRIYGREIVCLQFNVLGQHRFTEFELVSLENKPTHLERFTLGPIPNLELTKLRRLEFIMFDAGRKTKVSRQPHGIVNLLKLLLPAATEVRDFEFFNLILPPFLGRHVTAIEPVGAVISTLISKSVKNLRLHMHFSEQDFTALAERGLALRKFEFSHPPGLPIGALRKFLEGQAAALKAFAICPSFDSEDAVALELPRLEELFNLGMTHSLATPFSFAGNLPQLQRLDMSDVEPETLSDVFSNCTKASPALKELHLPREAHGLIAPLVKKIPGIFPGLTDLHVSVELLDSEMFQEVFTHLGSIESLSLFLDGDMHNLDSALTGISAIDCEGLRGRTFRNVNVEGLRRKPSIHNLAKLRKLVLKATELWCEVVLSNVSAQFAFLEMDSLRELNLIGVEHQINPRYMNRLQEKVKLKWEAWSENWPMGEWDEEID